MFILCTVSPLANIQKNDTIGMSEVTKNVRKYMFTLLKKRYSYPA